MSKLMLTAIIVLTISGAAAAVPVAGDIAIIGYHADVPDTFAFVALADLAAGDVIHFTDNGWDAGTNSLRTTQCGEARDAFHARHRSTH